VSCAAFLSLRAIFSCTTAGTTGAERPRQRYVHRLLMLLSLSKWAEQQWQQNFSVQTLLEPPSWARADSLSRLPLPARLQCPHSNLALHIA
jgi:hypothetical protein